MGNVVLTANELVATLRNSALPTVLIEGKTDLEVFRKLENRIGLGKVDFLPCGGKNTVLEVFKHRNQLHSNKVMFFVDRDLWYFHGIPQEYADLMVTQGYSIENDLYFDGHERLNELLDQQELSFLSELLQNVAIWFAFEIENVQSGGTAEFEKVKIMSETVMPKKSQHFDPAFLQYRSYKEPANHNLSKVSEDHYSGLRGKYIFDCLHKIFIHLRDNEGDYSQRVLRDLCYREGIKSENETSRINQLLITIQARLQ
jgi:hypothetical protein